jgi:hypothetical protein
MRIQDYLILAGAGTLVTLYKILSTQMEKIIPFEIAKKAVLGLIIAVLIVPAIMEYYQLTLTIGIALTSVINLFVEVIMKRLEKKIETKIDNI